MFEKKGIPLQSTRIVFFLFGLNYFLFFYPKILKKAIVEETKIFIKRYRSIEWNFKLPKLQRFNFSFTIPLILVNSDYNNVLLLCITQAHKILPHLPIFVIIDKFCDGLPSYTKQYLANKNSTIVKLFHKYYIHRSVNGVFYEKFCFLRWFYITDFLLNHNEYNFFFTFDSDVLIYIDFFKLPIFVSSLKSCDAITMSNQGGILSILCVEYILKFCHFTLYFYRNIFPLIEFQYNLSGLLHFYLKYKYFPYDRLGKNYRIRSNIDDMTLFSLYNSILRKYNYSICSDLFFGKYAINENIHDKRYFHHDNLNSEYINITFKNNIPTAKHIKTNETFFHISLHFQNGAKAIMNKYLT